MIMISNFLFSFTNFCVIVRFFLTKLLTLGVLLLTKVRAVVVAKLVILGISVLTSFILALKVVLVAKLISSILSYIFFILALYTPFLTTLFFTASLNLLKSAVTVLNLGSLLFFLY